MPTISKGWEKDRERLMSLGSPCMTMASEGIAMPKWAAADVENSMQPIIITKNINFFISVFLLRKMDKRAKKNHDRFSVSF
jgi:hypothetical protein